MLCPWLQLRQDDIAVGFFRFCYILYWFFVNGEKERKGDFSNRIIEFEAKNETIKMNRSYSKIDKKYGELNIFMRIMLMTKISLAM